MNKTTRQATTDDADALIILDHVAQSQPQRVEFIQRAIAERTLWIAEAAGAVVGYGVLDHTFFDHGMIKMIYVHLNHRRHGVGSALAAWLELRCRTPKLFTSTNLSNRPMQLLLAKRGYVLSGFIDNLDEGDPELIYLKRLDVARVSGE